LNIADILKQFDEESFSHKAYLVLLLNCQVRRSKIWYEEAADLLLHAICC